MPLAKYALIGAVVILLSGCFRTTTPVFEFGDKFGLSGHVKCTAQLSNKHMEITEETTGMWPFLKTRYLNGDGTVTVYRKLGDSELYLAQTGNEKEGYAYSYMSVSGDKSVAVMVPNTMVNSRRFEDQIKSLGLRIGSSQGLAWLGGDAKQIAKFLTGITAEQLMPVGTCSSV
jgi:hypothetical protein